MAIRVSHVANLLSDRKLSMFLNTFTNDSCTTSSASSWFLVILFAVFKSRCPYLFTRSSNAHAVRDLRAFTRPASGSAEDRTLGLRSSPIGWHRAWVCICWGARRPAVDCGMIFLHANACAKYVPNPSPPSACLRRPGCFQGGKMGLRPLNALLTALK